jgi:phage N-6-adenine-methyltransferase
MLDREFHFTLDVCAAEDTATCTEWFGENALQRPWVPVEAGVVWANPPYGRGLGDWVEKAYRESVKYHQTVVMLLPARSDTQWFHEYCLKGEIRFLRGRLNFDDVPNRIGRCPFPSMIVVFWAGGKKKD